MNKWSEHLTQDTLSGHLIQEMLSHLSEGQAELIAELSTPCDNKRDISAKRRIVKKVASSIPDCVLQEVLDELDEISKDIGWKKSPRGKYISAINDWVQPFHSEIRSNPRFDSLAVGGHVKHEVVFVAGKAENQNDLDELLKLLAEHNPPYKILVDVKVGPA